MYLPAYIPYDPITYAASGGLAPGTKIYIKYFKAANDSRIEDITTAIASVAKCNAVTTYTGNGYPIDQIADVLVPLSAAEKWCVSANASTQNRPVINVKAYSGSAPANQWKYASIIIEFQPVESLTNTKVTVPGSPYYYLTKLGRLELLGIPQITYEPLYCNNDHNKVVPGIFKSPLVNRATFQSPATQTIPGGVNPIGMYDELSPEEILTNFGNGDRRFTYMDKVDHPAIFSSKDFTCCTPLGKETNSAEKCCSGNAQTTTGGRLLCKLPRGTNLNVYFNKFVSNEGVGEDQPAGGLVISTTESETDFIAATGEPKMRESTFAKLEALGAVHCASGIVGTGGAFGQFMGEPLPSGYTSDDFPLSIVDSQNDGVGETGKFPFDSGYRWNHHYYCK
jgi:hypothetical protein